MSRSRTDGVPTQDAAYGKRGLLIIALFAVVAVLTLYVRWSWAEFLDDAQGSEPSGALAVASDSARSTVTTDLPASPDGLLQVGQLALGEVVRIAGPNPQSTLTEYCAQAGLCAAGVSKRVVETTPARPGIRLGLFNDVADPSRALAVVIRRDLKSRRWVVGDGEQVRVFELNELPTLFAPNPDSF